jgi:hypothetical protein
MDIAVLVVQCATVLLMAGWLTLGLRDNLLHPEVNEDFTAEVLSLERLRRDWPRFHTRLAHRAVLDRHRQRLVFGLVVAAEALVALALWAAVLALAGAAAGLVGAPAARVVALMAVLGFTLLWGGFLVVGNHFAYWLGHDGAQVTHFLLLLWGMAGLVLLTAR